MSSMDVLGASLAILFILIGILAGYLCSEVNHKKEEEKFQKDLKKSKEEEDDF